MKNNKVVALLKLFSEEELNLFCAYVGASFFNERKTLAKLAQVLVQDIVQGQQELSRQEVYKRIFGESPFRSKSLQTNLSQLYVLTKDFLALQELEADPVLKNRLLLQRFIKMGANKYFNEIFKKASSTLEGADLNASDDFFEQMLLEELKEQFHFRNHQRTLQSSMKTAVDNLGNSFVVRSLRYRLRNINLEQTFEGEAASPFTELALKHVEANYSDQVPIVKIYYAFLKAYCNPEDFNLFTRAHNRMKFFASELPSLDKEELYVSALNYAIRNLNNGRLEFLPLTFDLYEEMLRQELVQKEGLISPYHYNNISHVALRSGKTEWATNFISDWKGKVHPDYAQNAFQFNQGILHFFLKEFKQAERHFNELLGDYRDIFYALNAKGYLLQIYYETGQLVSLESQAHSFRMFLRRQKELTLARQQPYLDFINHLKRLINCAPNHHKKLLKLRSDMLGKENGGMGKQWLLEKIEELTLTTEPGPS